MKKENGITKNQGKSIKPLFDSKESYQHYFAKLVLKKWLELGFHLGYIPVKVVLERKFCMNSDIYFVPDITVYNEKGVAAYYEVLKNNPVSHGKLIKIIDFHKAHKWPCSLFEIRADWIMSQTVMPNYVNIEREFKF